MTQIRQFITQRSHFLIKNKIHSKYANNALSRITDTMKQKEKTIVPPTNKDASHSLSSLQPTKKTISNEKFISEIMQRDYNQYRYNMSKGIHQPAPKHIE